MYANYGRRHPSVLVIILGFVHAVQLGEGPEPRPPVAQEVIIQVWAGGGAVQRAEAPGQRLRAFVAIDVQGVVGEAVPVVVRLVLLHLDHHGHVALAGAGLGLVRRFLDHGVERRVGMAVWVTQEGAVMAGGGQDGDIVAERDEGDVITQFLLVFTSKALK